MGFLTISRELLNSPFWENLSDKEKVIIIDLMKTAAYKPMVLSIQNLEVSLERYDACVSINSLAAKYEIGRKKLANFLERLANHDLVKISIVTGTPKGNKEGNSTGNSSGNYQKSKNISRRFTLLSFCTWVFGLHDSPDRNNPETGVDEQAGATAMEQKEATHNKEVSNKEGFKKDKKNSACAGLLSKGSQSADKKKVWYEMEEIGKLNVAFAKEIMGEWKKFSGRSEKEIRTQLVSFARKKKHLGLPEMTMDIFDKEFRKEMKQVFALKSKHRNEQRNQLKELGVDDEYELPSIYAS